MPGPAPGSLARVEVHDPSTYALIDILENAHAIGYEKAENQAPVGSFMLPRDDAKWSAIAAFREVWMYDDLGNLVDVFRIMPTKELHDDSVQDATITLEGLATFLQDDIVPAEVIWTNQTVTTILTQILAYQSVARIALGTIDAALNITLTGYRVAFDNLMKACWGIRNVVGGYITVDPVAPNYTTRQLNLRVNPGNDIGQRIWQGFNLRSIGKTSDPTEAVTKLWPLGRGEGNNQQRPSSDLLTAQPATLANSGVVGQVATLTITDLYSRYKGWTAAGAALPDGHTSSDTRVRPLKVFFGATDDSANWRQGVDERTLQSATTNYTPPVGTPTLNYVHADYLIADDTVGTYGTIQRPYTDKRFESSLELIRATRAVLDTAKLPRVSYDVAVADIVRNLPAGDPALALEGLHLFDQINVVDSVLGLTSKLRIVRESYKDLWDPSSFEVGVGLTVTPPSIARVMDRQRTYDTTPDGATNIWVDSFEDNLDAAHPYTRSIYIPTDAVSVNKLTLNMLTKAYRYYVSTLQSGGSVQTTNAVTAGTTDSQLNLTSGNHNHTQTDSGSPGSTTDSTGSSAHTTDGQGLHNHGISAATDTSYASHDHATGVFSFITGSHNHNGGVSGDAGTHSHNVNSHTHSHGHTVSHNHTMTGQPADGAHSHPHTHTVTSTHSHTVDTTHTHNVNPGIVETTTPTTMQVTVDGNVASASATSLTDFDLTPFLTKDSSGKIVRGWHQVVFTPNANGRVQCAIVEVVFIQSRGIVAG